MEEGSFLVNTLNSCLRVCTATWTRNSINYNTIRCFCNDVNLNVTKIRTINCEFEEKKGLDASDVTRYKTAKRKGFWGLHRFLSQKKHFFSASTTVSLKRYTFHLGFHRWRWNSSSFFFLFIGFIALIFYLSIGIHFRIHYIFIKVLSNLLWTIWKKREVAASTILYC